jgi:peptide/nickel transport system substrate-binding protein
MLSKKLFMFTAILIITSMVLAACQPQVQEVVTTVVVTKEVQVEGETVIQTQIVEVQVTPTPEPEEMEAPLASVSPEFKNADTYTVVTIGDPETLDPAWTYETAGSGIETNIYEGLVFWNRETTDEYIPALATDWTINEDGTVWTFNIRDGVTFHAGGTLEPHDVAYTTARALLQGRIDGPHWMTYEVFFGPDYAVGSVRDFAAALEGADSFDALSAGQLADVCEQVKAAVVADDEAGTVTYTLAQPSPWFLALMGQVFLGAITDQEWMVENGDWDGDCATWQDFADPAAEDTILFNQANGTGPYMLDHWTPNEEIVLTANENYWRTEPMWEGGPSGAPSIKTVVIKPISEWGTRLAMFEAGDADYIYVPAQFRSQIEPYYKTICQADGSCVEGNPDGYVQVYQDLPQVAMTPAQFNWQINTEGGNPFVGSGELDGNGIPGDFFQDIHVRKAMNYCFDFDAMISDALAGDGVQAQGPIIQGMMGYRDGEAPLYSFDLAKCEEEFKLADLDKDGVPAGEDDDDVWNTGFYFQLGYNTGNDTRRLASEILKAGIETVNPSFNVSVVGMPWPVLLNTRREGRLPIYVGGWLEDFHDPHNWVQPFLSSQGAYGRIVNMTPDEAAAFDALILEGASLTDPEERRPVYEEIQLKAQEDAVNIWMYQAVGRVHFQEWIHDFYYNPGYSSPENTWVYALSKSE